MLAQRSGVVKRRMTAQKVGQLALDLGRLSGHECSDEHVLAPVETDQVPLLQRAAQDQLITPGIEVPE